jgi:pre-mRNA-splicing factor 38A
MSWRDFVSAVRHRFYEHKPLRPYPEYAITLPVPTPTFTVIMSKPVVYDKADAKALLDDRGYTGTLIRGQNPALLFEKGVRERITDSYFWKEQCFGLNAATLCDRAAELKFIGGTTGIMGKPTPFLCLAFKLLQLVPEKDIILEFLNFRDDDEEEEDGEMKEEVKEEPDGDADAEGEKKEEDLNATGKLGSFKYLRCLAAFYIRLAWEPVEIYKTLEPLLTDLRKVKRRTKDGFILTYMDQFVDDLLTKDRMCATALWKMPPRSILEDMDMLEPRESPLADEVDAMDEDDASRRSRSSSRSRSRSHRSWNDDRDSRSRSRSRSMSRSRSRNRNWTRSRSRSPVRSRSRSRTRSEEYSRT